ncbi:hypothetical protein BR10RB9215_C10898 [Brucella sp. 10RB9215]|nr:hypothetical protein BR10RB9215_C10898 [Brucella sp. 10RB9215]
MTTRPFLPRLAVVRVLVNAADQNVTIIPD